jgi:hypothetical protein
LAFSYSTPLLLVLIAGFQLHKEFFYYCIGGVGFVGNLCCFYKGIVVINVIWK